MYFYHNLLSSKFIRNIRYLISFYEPSARTTGFRAGNVLRRFDKARKDRKRRFVCIRRRENESDFKTNISEVSGCGN